MAIISATKARAYTRKGARSSASAAGLLVKLALLVMSIATAWAVFAIRPPSPKVCGSPNGPPVTAPRIKLRDGRHLAYKEAGVPREEAKHKIVVVHAYTRSRHDLFPVSKDTIQKLGLYLVGYDRAGYGQSDPNPKRSIESEVQDIQELADSLNLGSKFYLVSHSIGAHAAWGCLKHIPHRLAGVGMIVPVVNYWWPSLSQPEGKAVFDRLPIGDRLFLSVAHYSPWLLYWWMTQKILPTSSTVNPQQSDMCPSDWESRMKLRNNSNPEIAKIAKEALQQGVVESLVRDTVVMFGKWSFDPAEVNNPGEDGKTVVHVWQGEKDFLVPVELQRIVMKKLPWINYREVADKGHYLLGIPGFADEVASALVS